MALGNRYGKAGFCNIARPLPNVWTLPPINGNSSLDSLNLPEIFARGKQETRYRD
jgi:hypothetical protein